MIDLLSPVGDFDCLKAAVQNGANSVYFGANLFSARAFASNFDLDELKNAIQYARIRGVKTNLTLNTLIKNDEFEYHVNRQSFSKNELTKIVNNLKTSYYKNEKPPKLYFIKNYFTINCYFIKNDKYMDLNLINPENTNYKNYTITFKNTEILEFLNIIEKTII